MESDIKDFKAEESLRLITDMIQQAQGKVQRNAFYFLLWGWVTVVGNAGMFLLSYFSVPRPYMIWLITIPAWFITFYKVYRSRDHRGARTHFDSVTAALWISFGIFIATVVAFGFQINYQINALILLAAAIPTFVSGVLIRFRPLMAGGVFFWIFGVISFLIPINYQPIVAAAAITVGYLVPGYLLRSAKH